MRPLHRILSLFSVLVMLYLGVTGTVMQLCDLAALLSHAPETDPVMLSINEGRAGNGDIAVLSPTDLTAATLPVDLDYRKAIETTLRAMHRAAPGRQPNLLEIREVDGHPTGQIKIGEQLQAFDAISGARIAVGKPISPDAPLPPSIRQSAKELHRFWGSSDKPGVYLELLAGIILWVLIISGLTMYYRLLAARMKAGRMQPFWMGGGAWRSLHRLIARDLWGRLPWRDDRHSVLGADGITECGGIIALVTEHIACRNIFDERNGLGVVARLSRR